MVVVRASLVVVVLGLGACQKPPPPPVVPPAVRGSALFVNMNPSGAPRLVGAYDFDLLAQGSGKACVFRGGDNVYWIGMSAVVQVTNDSQSQQAIAAAALDAISRLDDADTIVLTSVVTDSDGKKTCATVMGRGVRLKKADAAASATAPASEAPK